MKVSFILKCGEDSYVKAKGDSTTKYPDLAWEFPTPQAARQHADQYEGGSAWEVWDYQVKISLVPGV